MAFVDYHAAGEAPVAAPAPRNWKRARHTTGSARRRHPLATAAVTLATLAATALFATSIFDDRLLGALSAVLLYAITAPAAARLFQASARQPRVSYQGMNQTTHRRG